MELSKDYILFCRNLTKNKIECLLYFDKEVKFLQKFVSKLKKKNCVKCFVFCDLKYDVKATYILNIMIDTSFDKKIYFEDCLPNSDLTKEPQLCPVVFEETDNWKDIKNTVVLSNMDWDFYQLDWILQRWETSLGIFDYDNFWIASSYPLDIYNIPVHYKIVLFYIKLGIRKLGLKTFQLKFFGLYQFYKDKLGKLLLEFFYDYTLHPIKEKAEIFQKIHKIYHSISVKHPYRRFLFYNNYSLTVKNEFKMNLYIQQYISFYGMFVCQNFCNLRKEQIINGIDKGSREYISFFDKNEDKLLKEIKFLHDHYDHIFHWIGRDTLKTLKNPFWKYVYINWNMIPRNINLWDSRVLKYNDHQYKIGENLLSMFPVHWIRNFHDKKFICSKRKINLP